MEKCVFPDKMVREQGETHSKEVYGAAPKTSLQLLRSLVDFWVGKKTRTCLQTLTSYLQSGT